MKLSKNALHLFRDRQSKVSRILQQGYTLIGQVEAHHGAAQSIAGSYHMKINDVGNTHQHDNSLIALSKALDDHGIVNDGSLDDILTKCADVLEQIIMEAASPKGKRDFNDACDAVEQALRRMPRPDMQDPPDKLADHEQVYIQALYEAYGQAAQVDGFDQSSLASFPEYDEDLKERRIDYFSAESIRCSIMELQGADLQDQFSVLKSEVYAGVRNTALKRYDDGFERMLNVMEQAIATSVDQYILSRSPYWINNRIKQGVCHFLVTDGRLRWVKRNG